MHVNVSQISIAGQVRRNAGGGVLREDGAGLTKAIVFSQFWQHILLVGAHLRAHGVTLAVLKRDLSPAEKAHALDMFQVLDFCCTADMLPVLVYKALTLDDTIHDESP